MSKTPASISIEVDDDDMELKKELTKDKPLSNHSKVNKRAYLKYGSLIMLIFQNSALSITMRMARTQKDLFISSTAVIMGELLKLITCLAMIRLDEGSNQKLFRILKTQIYDKPFDTLKVAVPSIIYYVQNNLIYFGATHLDAATAQVTYQIKILTTAIFSVLMLNRKLGSHQWLALMILFFGVVLVQLQQTPSKKPASGIEQRPILGFFSILLACCCSGFAGVYFEKILKGTADVSLWLRNIQLSAIAIPFGLIQVFITDHDKITEKGFFFGYGLITCIVIMLQAQGGLLTAVVVKYSDNIMKGFATSLAIIVSCVVSIYVFDFQLSIQFTLGAALVIGSLFLFNKQIS